MESTDVAGNRYSFGYGLFIRAVPGITSFRLKSECTIILTKSSNDYAFIDCKSTLETLEFEAGSKLEAIQSYAFQGCNKLKQLNFSLCSDLIIVKYGAFSGCSNVALIVLPPNLQIAELWSFSGICCPKLFIPCSVLKLLGYSFANNKKLTTIEWEQNPNITRIDDAVFASCPSLVEFIIPNSITFFSGVSLLNDNNFERIILETGNTVYKLIDGVLYSNQNQTLVYYPPKLNPNFSMPNFVQELASFSFSYAILDNIVLSKALTKIQNDAFIGSSLTSIVLPQSLTYLAAASFRVCSKLSNITFLCNLTTLYGSTFLSCGFSSFDVPDGISKIDASCFASNQKLENVTLPSSLTSLGGGAFSNCHPKLRIIFREPANMRVDSQMLIFDLSYSSISMYFGSDINTTIIIPSSVKTIKARAFDSKSNIVSIAINESSNFTDIEEGAFSGCSNLISFPYLPFLRSIGANAFYFCIKLSSFSFGPHISYAHSSSFGFCYALSSITMKSNCQNLRFFDSAFSYCQSLETIHFEEGLQRIGTKCFIYCSKLESLTFPSSLLFIDERAFDKCGLRNINFPSNSSLSSFGPFCFYKSEHLQTIHFPPIKRICKFSFAFTSIFDITLPKSVEYLEDSSFQFCNNLTFFSIPQESCLSSIGFGVFEGCKSFEKITCGDQSNYTVENQALFNIERSELIVMPPSSKIRYFYFPSSVTIIKQSSFLGCSSLECVIIPDNSVRSIEAHAFEDCHQLHFINFPESITSVGLDAFKGCKHLRCGIRLDNIKLLSIFNDIGKLPYSAFKDCFNVISCKKISRSSFPIKFIAAFLLIK